MCCNVGGLRSAETTPAAAGVILAERILCSVSLQVDIPNTSLKGFARGVSAIPLSSQLSSFCFPGRADETRLMKAGPVPGPGEDFEIRGEDYCSEE
jgi:hypothetical protein